MSLSGCRHSISLCHSSRRCPSAKLQLKAQQDMSEWRELRLPFLHAKYLGRALGLSYEANHELIGIFVINAVPGADFATTNSARSCLTNPLTTLIPRLFL